MKLAIRNGRIVNHDAEISGDILIEAGRIIKIGKINGPVDEEIDAAGKYVLPGFIDLHTHLRTPGREDEEDLSSGSAAAAKGGFTTIFCMPNTDPALDNEGLIRWIIEQSQQQGLIDIFPVGAISKGRKGRELTEFGSLKKAGCRALSDDGDSVGTTSLLRRALEYAKMFDLLLVSHCEDAALSGPGVMREGVISSQYGMAGICPLSESLVVFRDIELARYLNTRIHLAHISTRQSIDIIARAKQDGIRVTCETAPHYFSLTEGDVERNNFHGNWKVNPPLGDDRDIEAVRQGLKTGVIDCIATDHAPHSQEEKNLPFEEAPCGFIGLEWAFSLGYTHLVKKNILTLPQLVEKMCFNPARIMGLAGRGYLIEGSRADLVVVDLETSWRIAVEAIISKSANTPFREEDVQGKVLYTIHKGKVVYRQT